MNIGKLKKILAKYPDDMEVVIDLRRDDDKPTVELRDAFNCDKEFEKTVLQIRHWNYGTPIGHKHLKRAAQKKERIEILDGLADVFRSHKWATRRFTRIHGDYRIYHHNGHRNDTCYGHAYDPRLFTAMAAEGLVAINETGSGYDTSCEITNAGLAYLAKAQGKDVEAVPAGIWG